MLGEARRPLLKSGKRRLSGPQAAGFAVALAVLLALALLPVFPRQLQTQEGDTASRTWQAPRDISFESQVLTDKQRQQAAAAVPDVLAFSPAARSDETTKLDKLLNDIVSVRNAPDLTRSQKLSAIQGTENLSAPGYEPFLLDMSGDEWQTVSAEAKRLLDAVLAGTVVRGQENQIADQISQQVNSSLSANESAVVQAFVKPLVVSNLSANLEVDSAKTAEARQNAAAAVMPVRVSYTKNQTIVRGGEVIDSTAIEAMREAGLLSRRLEWHSAAAVVLLALLSAGLLGFYIYSFQPENTADIRRLALLLVVTALAALAAKLYLPLVLPDHDRHFLAYALPLAAVPMLVASLVEGRLAVVVAGVMAALVTFVVVYLPDVSASVTSTPLDALRVVGVYGFGGVAGALTVHKAERLNRYALGGLLVALVSLAVLAAVWLLDLDRKALDIPWIALAAATNGLLSAILAVGAFVTLGFLFGITTRVQLMELAQLNQPLLRRLQDQAPGTFHHSIIVGNLAERAADLIGADALLVRVGCYYHDVGKLRRPGYYIENQLAGSNPHDDMAEEKSSQIISSHVQDGLDLAREHGLPRQVREFIAQHHGTGRTNYFYRKALAKDEDTDPALFTYPGPKPQSREAAIVMLADSADAAIRSAPNRSPEVINACVDEVIAERLGDGQLDECDLTLRELSILSESFKSSLRGVYHPRLEYPPATDAELRARKRSRRHRIPSPLSPFSVSDEDEPAEDDGTAPL